MSKAKTAPAKPDEIAISVSNVNKTFKLPHEKQGSLKGLFVNVFNRDRTYEKQHVLKDISFEIKKGEFFGIVGRNGSGKSTLLKLLAGIYTPDTGTIEVNGKLTPFIELGVGFNPELTGRENVFLNGALLGFNRKEMLSMYDEIVEFAELEKFMDQKLKNYSSGMQVRLAFSIAIRANTDILVLDEVLAVGDEAFQKKCFAYFAELKRKKKTVILVTHSMDHVQQFCTRAMLIEKGKIVEEGNTAKVSQRYRELFMDNEEKGFKKKDGSTSNNNVDAKVRTRFDNGKRIFDIIIKPKKSIEECVLAMIIFRQDGLQVWNWASDYNNKSLPGNALDKGLKLTISIEDIFPVDTFYVNLYIRAKDRTKDYAIFEDIARFTKHPSMDLHIHDKGWQPSMEIVIRE